MFCEDFKNEWCFKYFCKVFKTQILWYGMVKIIEIIKLSNHEVIEIIKIIEHLNNFLVGV